MHWRESLTFEQLKCLFQHYSLHAQVCLQTQLQLLSWQKNSGGVEIMASLSLDQIFKEFRYLINAPLKKAHRIES